ncbi:MAG: DUF4252 domain-containing protein [Prevotella sp.]|nr:DUF4252 domain-containing protein [Prevotella sp.]
MRGRNLAPTDADKVGTSPEQESELFRRFASAETVPAELQADQEAFLKLYSLSNTESADIDMPQGFDERLETLLADEDRSETSVIRITGDISTKDIQSLIAKAEKK